MIGLGEGENFIASDIPAILEHTRKLVFLESRQMAVVTRDHAVISTIEGVPVKAQVSSVAWDPVSAEKGEYRHFMQKEIHEQVRSLTDTLAGRVDFKEGRIRLPQLNLDDDKVRSIEKIILTACGTASHAGMVGRTLIERIAKIPATMEIASEFRYSDPIVNENTVVIAISQSGETADTLAAVREAKRKRAKVFGICNVVGSTIARETDAGIYLHCGPEIGVASTKAFTSQVTVLSLMTLLLARMTSMSASRGREIVQELKTLPDKIQRILDGNHYIEQIAGEYADSQNFLYLGRGYNFPVALEGALKLKEISYIHAEGYPAAEMKHGPIALIDENMPVVFIATKDSTYEKIISNIEEVRARKGKVIAIATEGDEYIQTKVDHTIYIPATLEFLTPILTIIPLQLLAYYIAAIRGCDVDQPRNLAKSVTVE